MHMVLCKGADKTLRTRIGCQMHIPSPCAQFMRQRLCRKQMTAGPPAARTITP